MKSPDASRGRPLRVLLVEDSANDALLLLWELRRGGYEPVCERVSTPEDMERQLAEASTRGEPWEIVISDYYMPRFTAPDALVLLRRLGYDTPFIVVSGKIGEEAAVEVIRAGAQDYVAKENMVRLCPAIERELREAKIRRERQEAEEALSRSEAKFRRLVEQAADAIFVHDLEGNFLDVNRRACESLGYTREELLRMAVPDVEVNYAPGSLVELWKKTVDGGPRTLVGIHRRKDGTTFPVEVRVGVLESDEERLMLVLARDISERRAVESRLREAENRFRALVERIPAITYVQSPYGTKPVEYISPQVEQVLGYLQQEETMDEGFFVRIVHPEDRERYLAEDERTDRTGEPFSLEYRQVARDGRVVWFRDEAVLVRDEEGKPLYWLGVQFDISDQKRIEEELKGSQERYRTFIEQSTEGIWRCELEQPVPTDGPEDEQLSRLYRYGYLAECNDAMARMYGYERAEDIKGARLGDLLPPSIPENAEYLLAAIRSGYRLTGAESQKFDTDGNVRYFMNNLTGIVEGGLLMRVWGIQRDITERRRAEEALRLSEELYRAVVDQAAENIFIVDMQSRRILRANAALSRSMGYTPEELEEMTLYDIVAHDRQNIDRNIQHVVEGGRFVGERRYRRKDGTLMDVEVSASAIEYGGREAMCVVAHDVTGRKMAEEVLKESEERYRAVMEQAAEGIYLADARSGRILETNPSMRQMLGYTTDELRDMELHSLLAHPREEVDSDLALILRDKRHQFGDRKYRRKDGTLVDVEVSASVIHYGGREILCAVVHDITERKEAERQIQEVREAERSRIARDLHDDIVQDIVYALQEIQIVQITSGNGGDAALEDAAEALRRSVEGLRSAIFELRLGTLSQSFISAVEVLVDLNRRMGRKSYELKLTVKEEFPQRLPGRISRELTRIIQEALTNVRRHANARHVEVKLWVEGDLACVEVADDGRGFDVGRSQVGIGLQSMRHRARRLRGELEVDSEAGKGTRVRFKIPLSRLSDDSFLRV